MLRVLNIWGIKTSTCSLSSEIGSLIHLRYLGIRESNIIVLPKSVGKLRNLLTLDYRNVVSDDNEPIKIPNALQKLSLLRHLFLPVECSWGINDLQLSNLRNLQTLWGIKQGGHWLSTQVMELSTTLKKLKIVVSTQQELDATFRCPSLVHDKLHTFHCEMVGSITLKNVEPLSSCEHLHKLALIGKIQMELPLLLPTNIVMLDLKDSKLEDVDPMVALGALAHLKFLRLSNAYQGSVLACGPRSFPELEELYLERLQNLDTWTVDNGALPCLKNLEIITCRKLLPKNLPTIPACKTMSLWRRTPEYATEYLWSQQKLRLPHNYETIVKLSDSPIDTSSVRKLYKQLIVGIFLVNKTMKYWVIEQDGCCYNCFKVFILPTIPTERCERGIRRTLSDGALMAKQVSQLKWHGSLNIAYLSPCPYKIAWMIWLNESFSWEEASVKVMLEFPDGTFQSHNKKLNDVSLGHWVDVWVGEFDMLPGTDSDEEIRFSLDAEPYSRGLAVRGVILEPN